MEKGHHFFFFSNNAPKSKRPIENPDDRKTKVFSFSSFYGEGGGFVLDPLREQLDGLPMRFLTIASPKLTALPH